MASVSVDTARVAPRGDLLLACVAEHGSAAHPYLSSDHLRKGPESNRNLADAIHYLCSLHGRHPTVIDHAASRCTDPAIRDWIGGAANAFAVERAYLAELAVAAGPAPGTPGSGGFEATVLAQRHAIQTLAQSERKGCALGAAMALMLDWSAIRTMLDTAAVRFGVEAPSEWLLGATVHEAAEAVASPAVQRALLFGAEQMLVQHRGLWDLLEARHQARSAT